MEKKDIASYSFEELQEEMLAIGEKGFRSRQIYSCLLYTSDAADE